MATERWLVTGGNGLLGDAVVRLALEAGKQVTAQHHSQEPTRTDPALTWLQLGLEDEAEVEQKVRDLRPAVVIHTAAMPRPEDCEADPQRAIAVNERAPAALARAAAALGARLVFVSTDLVFSGFDAPYAEADPTAPISVYGETKARAEVAIRAALPDHAIVRTSLILGPSPRGDRGADEVLLARIQRDGRASLFTDEFRCPLRAADLAAVLVALGTHPFRGTLHVVGPERLSRFEIGQRIVGAAGLPETSLVPTTIAAAGPTVPPRAPDVTLLTNRLHALVPPVALPNPIDR